MNKITLQLMLVLISVIVPSVVFAHHAEFMRDQPFLQGLSMPIHGMDHMLFTLAVGLIAAQIGGRAIWSVPLVFSVAILSGGVLNLMGVSIPLLEYGVLASITLCGALLSWRPQISLIVIVGVIALVTLLQGNALITDNDGLIRNMPPFIAGCLISSFLLLSIGLGVGLLISRMQYSLFRYVGFAVLAAAVVIGVFPDINGSIIHLLEI